MNSNYFQDAFSAPVSSADCAPTGRRQQVVMNSASGGVGPLPVINTLLAAPLNVVSTTIDTRNVGIANNLLIFTSVISLPVGISVTLNFQIHRTLNNGAPVGVGGTYTFAESVTVLEGEAFSFQFLDPDVQPGFYTYSVELSTNSLIDVTPGCCINHAVLSIVSTASR